MWDACKLLTQVLPKSTGPPVPIWPSHKLNYKWGPKNITAGHIPPGGALFTWDYAVIAETLGDEPMRRLRVLATTE